MSKSSEGKLYLFNSSSKENTNFLIVLPNTLLNFIVSSEHCYVALFGVLTIRTHRATPLTTGAGNGIRTRDPELGRLALCQLSYSRLSYIWGGVDSNHRRQRQQIYSLPPLSTRVPPQRTLSWRRELNPRPADYKSAALPLSYASEFVFYNIALSTFVKLLI